MSRRCALLDCEIDEDMPTLGELTVIRENLAKDIPKQARLLIIKFKFKPTDVICPDCFWK